MTEITFFSTLNGSGEFESAAGTYIFSKTGDKFYMNGDEIVTRNKDELKSEYGGNVYSESIEKGLPEDLALLLGNASLFYDKKMPDIETNSTFKEMLDDLLTRMYYDQPVPEKINVVQDMLYSEGGKSVKLELGEGRNVLSQLLPSLSPSSELEGEGVPLLPSSARVLPHPDFIGIPPLE